MPLPMVADFAIRLAAGLAALLLITPWRQVPPAFFRTHCLVILALLVLGSLDLARTESSRVLTGVMIASAVLAYAGAVAWGMGLPRLGWPVSALIVLTACGIEACTAPGGTVAVQALNGAGRLASAALLGSTLSAMLLGHYYLTAPAMSISPLRRFVQAIGGSLAARSLLAAAGLWLLLHDRSAAEASWLFLSMRWGVGLLGAAVATFLAWRTVVIRSTQSATGILYICLILVLFGEVTSLALSNSAGVSL